MNHEVVTFWKGNMRFDADVMGHTVSMDAPEKSGGENAYPIPKPLVLTALTGCTGMDVVALLRKQNIELDAFSVKVKGEISKQTPIQYTEIELIYKAEGAPAFIDAAVQAVFDSQEKYCGVSDMLKKVMPLNWTLLYNGASVAHAHYEPIWQNA